MAINFFIPGVPVAKGRPRMTKTGHTYTPKKTEEYEELVKLSYATACGNLITDKPVAVNILFRMPIPKSCSKKQVTEMEANLQKPAKRPDIDNLIKAVLDGLNGVAYFDDKQVVAISAAKVYGAVSGTKVSIDELN